MIHSGILGSKIWKAVVRYEYVDINTRSTQHARLDFEVQQWLQGISPNLRLSKDRTERAISIGDKPEHSLLQVLLYLTANQMRITLHRQSLLFTTLATDNGTTAITTIDIAKESIRIIDWFHTLDTVVYRIHQATFNNFLVSALTVLLLGVCRAPALYAQYTRDEFNTALHLIEDLSESSSTAKRLWKKMTKLRHVGVKLGFAYDSFKANRQREEHETDYRGTSSNQRESISSRESTRPVEPAQLPYTESDDNTSYLDFAFPGIDFDTFPQGAYNIRDDLLDFFETGDRHLSHSSWVRLRPLKPRIKLKIKT